MRETIYFIESVCSAYGLLMDGECGDDEFRQRALGSVQEVDDVVRAVGKNNLLDGLRSKLVSAYCNRGGEDFERDYNQYVSSR